MSWTTICDLQMKEFSGNQALDMSDFSNHAYFFGGISLNTGFVKFLDSQARLEIPVRDDSLSRFAALRVQARVRPGPITRRFNIVEGWMSFALMILPDGRLMATVYDGENWVGLESGSHTVTPNQWSSIMFEYDGISIASLWLDGVTVQSKFDMPVAIKPPRELIALGYWPRGDGRYTLLGDLGHVRIERRDVEDYWRDAWTVAMCDRKLSSEQANALKELHVLIDKMDPALKKQYHDCAVAQAEHLRNFLHKLRASNPRYIVHLRILGERLRNAWCGTFDAVEARDALLEYFRIFSGGDPANLRFRTALEESLEIRRMCGPTDRTSQRIFELGKIIFPEMSNFETDLLKIADSV